MSNTLSEILAGLKSQATQITAADDRIMAALTAAAERDTARAEVAASTLEALNTSRAETAEMRTLLEALPIDTAQVEGVLAQHVTNLGTIEALLGKLDQPTPDAPAESTPTGPVAPTEPTAPVAPTAPEPV